MIRPKYTCKSKLQNVLSAVQLAGDGSSIFCNSDFGGKLIFRSVDSIPLPVENISVSACALAICIVMNAHTVYIQWNNHDDLYRYFTTVEKGRKLTHD
ncbi:hypothetical protein HOLleu_31135 [Holothuria leucospilota]|uniref:Uncharacterized protein n=1 Tax=Holothuria leucospilota TaxID=206669 RepID=A0A9Q1BLG3_HOLLE|nr:hypothetical protein HOLleu_31135 [Holothuria leucospilota]